jgi:hypothetical protein
LCGPRGIQAADRRRLSRRQRVIGFAISRGYEQVFVTGKTGHDLAAEAKDGVVTRQGERRWDRLSRGANGAGVCALVAFLWILLLASLTAGAQDLACARDLTSTRAFYWGGSAVIVLIAVINLIRRYRRRHLVAVAIYGLAVLLVGVAMFVSRDVLRSYSTSSCGG